MAINKNNKSMEDMLLKSETKKISYFFVLVISILISGFGCYSVYSAFSDIYPQLLPIGLGLLMLLIGYTLMRTNDSIDKLELYGDRVEVKSIFGRMKQTLYRDEMSWAEIEQTSKGKTWKVLILCVGEKKWEISSSSYKNYYDIKEELAKDKEPDLELVTQARKRGLKLAGLICLVLGTFFLVLFYYNYLHKNRIVASTEITRLKQVVTSPIRIHKGSKGSRSIRLRLKDYPEFEFEIDQVAYKATAAETFVANVKTGDTLIVDILTSEYQMKLTKEKEPGFFDKTVNYRKVEVYGLSDQLHTYLTLQLYNENNQSEGSFRFWVLGILGAVGITAGLIFLKKAQVYPGEL